MGVGDDTLRRLAGRGTEHVARRWADQLGMWVVCGFPKSGTTWLARVVADYLGLPLPSAARTPIAMPSVVHAHWRPHRRLTRVLYVHRDGRDVLVSLYFWRMNIDMPGRLSSRSAKLRERVRDAVGADFDPEDAARNLPRFIEVEMENPASTPLNWPDHVSAWIGALPASQVVTYDSLLQTPIQSLAPGLEAIGGIEVDINRLEESFARFSFEAQTGRVMAESEDRSTFLRRGGSGGWRDYFTREAAEVFDHHAGSSLIDLGYESDRSWIEGL